MFNQSRWILFIRIFHFFHPFTLQPFPEDPRTENLRKLSYGIILPIICTLGILGNVLNLIVLTRRNMRGTAYIYMRGEWFQSIEIRRKRHEKARTAPFFSLIYRYSCYSWPLTSNHSRRRRESWWCRKKEKQQHMKSFNVYFTSTFHFNW